MALAERLHKKGWTSAEIEHAMLHLNAAEQKKHPFVKFTDKSVYWVFLFALMLTIIMMVQVIFPFIELLPRSLGWFLLALIGFVFGTLFAHVLHGMEHLHDAHHTVVLFMVLSVTLVSSWVILGEQRLFGLVFAIGFSLLYGYYWWKK